MAVMCTASLRINSASRDEFSSAPATRSADALHGGFR